MRGDFRHAAGLLDNALASRYVDRRGREKSERDKYSDRSREHRAASARIHRRRRRYFLPSAGNDDYQRQRHHIARSGFHRRHLLAGVSVDDLFQNVELPDQLGVIAYSQRLFWWGERAKMPNWRNLSFDGGWDASGNGRPLGWQLGATFSAGGSRESNAVVWGDAYRITADGSTIERGLIQQSALTDVNGNALLQTNTEYSVRAKVVRSANLTQGTFRINCFSVSH